LKVNYFRESAMKTASELLDELVRETRPPGDCAITVAEHKGRRNEPNWTAGIGLTEQDALARYTAKFHELRDSCPRVDWSKVKDRVGERRRLTRWSSAVSQ
jgi:hypothetical protein